MCVVVYKAGMQEGQTERCWSAGVESGVGEGQGDP